MVHEISNDELAKGGDSEHNEGIKSDEGRRHRELCEALVEDLGQREGCALEDEPSDRCGEEDDNEHTAEQAPVHDDRVRSPLGRNPSVRFIETRTPPRIQEPGVSHPRCD